MNSQNQLIKAHLESGKTITGIEALELYGCFRLASRIYDIKSSGYAINKDMIESPSGKHIASYSKKTPDL
jgi:hypothetical protein